MMKWTNIIALTLVIVGALNWGLIGFFNFDLVTAACSGWQGSFLLWSVWQLHGA